MRLSEIRPGVRLDGVRADGPVEVVAFDRNCDRMGALTPRAWDGTLDQRLVSAEDALRFKISSGWRWTFGADGSLFRLALEDGASGLAHLFGPYLVI